MWRSSRLKLISHPLHFHLMAPLASGTYSETIKGTHDEWSPSRRNALCGPCQIISSSKLTAGFTSNLAAGWGVVLMCFLLYDRMVVVNSGRKGYKVGPIRHNPLLSLVTEWISLGVYHCIISPIAKHALHLVGSAFQVARDWMQ
jgi:hypothetical protein